MFTNHKSIKIIYEMRIKNMIKKEEYYSQNNIFILICFYFPNSGKEKLNYRIKEWDIDFYYFINDITIKYNNKFV